MRATFIIRFKVCHSRCVRRCSELDEGVVGGFAKKFFGFYFDDFDVFEACEFDYFCYDVVEVDFLVDDSAYLGWCESLDG